MFTKRVKMDKQISFAVVTITMVTLVATTTLQNAYAWSLYVDVSRSPFGIRLATVEIMGPFGYSDTRTVSTGPNAVVNFSIPDSAVPYGYPFRVCTHSEGTLLPTCDDFTHGVGNMRISMTVPR